MISETKYTTEDVMGLATVSRVHDTSYRQPSTDETHDTAFIISHPDTKE